MHNIYYRIIKIGNIYILYVWPFIHLNEALSVQKSYEQLLCKQNGDRALWEYPFAVAGVNITFMLIQMLDLQTGLFFTLFCASCLVDRFTSM
uniref:ELMO domain-containing protein n=1 Tax=Aegilops tauschii subsp. strangulata TaxID=200361 RepID=A0A452XNL9_AEGTS